jgi:hypothetical protein
MSVEVDLLREQRRVLLRGGAGLLFSALVLAVACLVLPGRLQLPDSTAERLAFALRADLFVFLWIVFAVQRVGRGRFRSAADIRGSAFGAPSPALALELAFLQNTLEQAVIAVGAHLSLAAVAGGSALALIPASVVSFSIGRVAFALGYPHGAGARAFGMAATLLPSVILYAVALWGLIAPLFRY